eukprot:1909635-Rhodomonas_salina.1
MPERIVLLIDSKRTVTASSTNVQPHAQAETAPRDPGSNWVSIRRNQSITAAAVGKASVTSSVGGKVSGGGGG